MNASPIKPIRSEDDCQAALARVAALMDQDRTAEEDDELDVLVTLIEVFEARTHEIPAPDPIEAIKFRMDQLGMSRGDLAAILGGRSRVSEVLSGKQPLTLAMIRALHQHMEIPADLLIQDGCSLPETPEGIDIDRLPLREMVKRGWIAADRHLKDRREEIARDLITAAGGRAVLAGVQLRQGGGRRNARTDLPALQAWCLHVLGQARQMGLEGRCHPDTITLPFLRDLARLSVFDDGPRLARERLAGQGIALVVAPHLPRTYLDGAALWTPEGVPVVAMTLRYDRLDNFWFCLLHELAHLGRHRDQADQGLFVDDLQIRGAPAAMEDVREQEADAWAQEALIPEEIWRAHPARHQPSVDNVLSLARQADVHPAIVAGRIRYERRSYRLLSQFVSSNKVRPLLMKGG